MALIMRTKPGLDTLSFEDLYNNLRVFECDVKGTTASSSSNIQNVAFVSADNTSSTNDVSTAYSISSSSVSKSQKEGSASYTDEINDDDMEEMDLKWQVAVIFMRINKFHKRTGRKLQFDTKDPVGFDKTKVECFNCHKMGHFARDCNAKGNQDNRRRDVGYNRNKAKDYGRRPAYQDDSKALVTIDGEDINWPGHVEVDTQNFAMMAYSSSNLGSDNESVFMNTECDLEDTPVTDRYAKGMHVVPPLMTGNYMPSGPDVEIDYSKFTYGNYMPSGPDVEIDYSKFTYGPKQTSVNESDSKPSENASCESDSSVETTTSMNALVKSAPKVVCEPKVWTDAPIIEEFESDSDDDFVENVTETGTPNHCPKVEKQGRNSHTRKGLGYAFTRKACFVCGSFSHLIRDCDYHEKRMAKQAELTKSKNRVTGQKEHRPVWNNVQRVNHQNKHMTGNKAHLADYQEFKGGSVAFGGSNGRITGKRKIKAGRLDFEDVYYVEELKHYNLFSVSQMCDKKNTVLVIDNDCLVLSLDFKLPDENQVLLKILRQHNMYSFNQKNIDPFRDLACLLLGINAAGLSLTAAGSR
nr:ribonuclease H-like domain-containing protein [Tanacetum cinerariifolium]